MFREVTDMFDSLLNLWNNSLMNNNAKPDESQNSLLSYKVKQKVLLGRVLSKVKALLVNHPTGSNSTKLYCSIMVMKVLSRRNTPIVSRSQLTDAASLIEVGISTVLFSNGMATLTTRHYSKM